MKIMKNKQKIYARISFFWKLLFNNISPFFGCVGCFSSGVFSGGLSLASFKAAPNDREETFATSQTWFQHPFQNENNKCQHEGCIGTVREIIIDLKERGKCVLFSSHIMQEVENLCEDIVIISKGIVKFGGSIRELRNAAGSQDLEEAFLKITGS